MTGRLMSVWRVGMGKATHHKLIAHREFRTISESSQGRNAPPGAIVQRGFSMNSAPFRE